MMLENKKIRRKKNKYEKISRKKAIIILIITFAIIVILFVALNMFKNTYGGLGNQDDIPQNEYNMSNVTHINGLQHYADDKYETMIGIDVSAYQGSINWQQVKASGIQFVMIRVGYRGSGSGNICEDRRFDEYIKGAQEAGIEVGVYFFSQAINTEEAIEEAKFVLNQIRGNDITYPICYDMEPVSSQDRIKSLSKIERTEITDAFCTIIDRHGYDAMIYGNQHWLRNNLDLSYLTDYDIWLAHYASTTNYSHAFKMWQYSNSGTLSGISGHVDLNMFFVEK